MIDNIDERLVVIDRLDVFATQLFDRLHYRFDAVVDRIGRHQLQFDRRMQRIVAQEVFWILAKLLGEDCQRRVCTDIGRLLGIRLRIERVGKFRAKTLGCRIAHLDGDGKLLTEHVRQTRHGQCAHSHQADDKKHKSYAECSSKPCTKEFFAFLYPNIFIRHKNYPFRKPLMGALSFG